MIILKPLVLILLKDKTDLAHNPKEEIFRYGI